MVAVARGGTRSRVLPSDRTPALDAHATQPNPVVVVSRSPVPPFHMFLEANRATVYRFLRVAVGPQDADDCFQETFIAALRAYPRLDDGELLDRWILRIASRKAIDHHRGRSRRPNPVGKVPDRAAPATDPMPDDELWDAVGSLPPRQRVAVVYRHVLDRPYAEIAELMGTSQEAARANVSQGVKKLRELMR
jgi:RNA polymerase sigma factor (sigma-70 family)